MSLICFSSIEVQMVGYAFKEGLIANLVSWTLSVCVILVLQVLIDLIGFSKYHKCYNYVLLSMCRSIFNVRKPT